VELKKFTYNMFTKIVIAFFAILFLLLAAPVKAQELTAMPSASTLSSHFVFEKKDNRVDILKNYLNKYNSPLADNAKDFVEAADMYDLDWKLVAAISGVESTFGHAIPTNSYNAWGWGVYGDNVIRFSSWKDGIYTISQGLREKYMNKWGGKDIYSIGRIYASSPVWADHVSHYLNKIDEFSLNDTKNTLSLSL
jgi:hypothetical protein